MEYTIKNLKTFRGMEGQGFNLDLYRDNVKIGMVIDSANGGEFQYDMSREEMEILNSYVKTLPPYKSPFDGEMVSKNSDIFIDELIQEYDRQKQYKKWCKKETVFKLKESKEGEFHIIKALYSPRIKTFIENKYGNDLVFILNERI